MMAKRSKILGISPATKARIKCRALWEVKREREKMWRVIWPYALGILIPLSLLGAFLFWEWSCDQGGGWASEYSACDFWTKGSDQYHANPN
jgi:hypothetical protein